MANASYVQDSFTGGEKSQLAQGRVTDREYRTWMNVCVNGHPTEAGGWVRRAGTMYAQHTRQGKAARVIKFDITQAVPYTMEFTDQVLRFRQGPTLTFTPDAQIVSAISGANPAVVQTPLANGWASGNTVMFAPNNPSSEVPVLLQNRQFSITVVDSTHFSLQDALTGANIDGSTLSAIVGQVVVGRVQELTTPYAAGSWQTVRSIQAETNAALLNKAYAPQLLSLFAPPSQLSNAQFSLQPLTFLDGPYLDPFTNGVQVTPNGLSGNILLTLGFPQWSSSQAYQKGQFVTSSSVNYESLIDGNVGNTPAGSPSDWVAVSPNIAINNGQGFLNTDIGRLVRLFSEPALWASGTTYNQGNVVSYNPTGAPGAATYWSSLTASNVGNIPGTDITHWQLIPSNAAVWTWGKIIGITSQVSPGAGTVIGNMTGGGGLAAAFDGNTVQPASASATNSISPLATSASIDFFVGKNFTGGAQQIASATVFGSSDQGLIQAVLTGFPGIVSITFVVNLRAKVSAPSGPNDGTILGSSGEISGSLQSAGSGIWTIGTSLVGGVANLISNDEASTWNYVWVECIASLSISGGFIQSFTASAAEVQFLNPPGSGPTTSIGVEILGPPLLYTNPIITWRLGAYSGTTGWPTVGTYHEGRVWLAGAIDNRFDASVSNGLSGDTLNMAPTDQTGTVGAANSISGTINSDGVNPIFWLMPDLQGVIMGSQAGEWLISAPSPGAMSPTNIQAVRVTKIGCAFVEPRKTDHTTVFVQRYTKKVMEYFTDVYSGKFSAPNLAKDTMHITKPLVQELAYTQANIPIIWGRNGDGSWWGATYKRDTLATSTGPTINGWHRHILGSGRSVLSICAGPSVGGDLDALTMVTLDFTTGIYHVEIMTDAVEEGDTLLNASYLDDAVNPTTFVRTTVPSVGAPYGSLTLNGLWHLNGKTVSVWLGIDCGDFTVSNGSVTVPYGDGISAGTANGLLTDSYLTGVPISDMWVGFTFTSQGQIVRPATPQESGARNGPAVGKKRRNHKLSAQLEGTGIGVSFGTRFDKLFPANFRQLNDTALLGDQQFTGVYKNTITDNNSYDGMLCWQLTRPYPCNIANIGGFIETSDE